MRDSGSESNLFCREPSAPAQVFRRKKNLRIKVYIYIYIYVYTSGPSERSVACSCKQVVRVRCLYELYARERDFKRFIFNR